jgi:hypothetical protein
VRRDILGTEVSAREDGEAAEKRICGQNGKDRRYSLAMTG